MDKPIDIKFEMSHEEIDKYIEDLKAGKVEKNAHDIAQIHAHVSPNGEDCKECLKKVIEAGIIIDFNEEPEDKDE